MSNVNKIRKIRKRDRSIYVQLLTIFIYIYVYIYFYLYGAPEQGFLKTVPCNLRKAREALRVKALRSDWNQNCRSSSCSVFCLCSFLKALFSWWSEGWVGGKGDNKDSAEDSRKD